MPGDEERERMREGGRTGEGHAGKRGLALCRGIRTEESLWHLQFCAAERGGDGNRAAELLTLGYYHFQLVGKTRGFVFLLPAQQSPQADVGRLMVLCSPASVFIFGFPLTCLPSSSVNPTVLNSLSL